MSNHFTYEIDERKLRVKLKDLETSPNEASWQKFETYYASQNKQSSSDIFKNIQIPLNRNVILPVVFGSVVILFSFLLFNFIDIKNPPKETPEKAQKTEAKPAEIASTPQPEQKQQIVTVTEKTAVPVPEPKTDLKKELPQPNLAQQKPAVTVTPTYAARTSPQTTQVKTQPQTVVQPLKQPVTQAIVQSPPAPAKTQVSAPVVAKTDTMAKKPKRRTVAEMVEADRADARPLLNADERTTEARPN